MLRMTEPLRQMVMERADSGKIRDLATAQGDLIPLKTSAWDMVCQGVTTPAEALRVVKT